MADAIITIKEKNYVLSELSKDIQDLVSIYKRWEIELSDRKIEVFKIEAALKSVGKEIEVRIEAQDLRVACSGST